MLTRRNALALAPAAALGIAAGRRARAQSFPPGVTATTIKIGQTMPYSGPASAYGTIGRSHAAYFRTVNKAGGINGRQIEFVSLDDGYSPPKTVEQTRRLIEQEQVSFIFAPLGTPTSVATRKYLNDKKIPQLFIGSGATFWGDQKSFPFSMGWAPTYSAEGAAYAEWLIRTKPSARLAMMGQNDDSGRDYMDGCTRGFGDKAAQMIALRTTYEVTDPTLDSQIVAAKQSGADTLLLASNPKFSALGIRKVYEMGWKPTFFLSSTGTSVASAIRPAGFEKAQGIISAFYLKDPNDEEWASDEGVRGYFAWMKSDFPDGDAADLSNVYGYSTAQTIVQVLTQCGNDLSRENIMRQAENLNFPLPLLLPGSKITTSATDHYPIEKFQMAQFDKERWKLMPA
ncbi:MAG: ABC transporter substrate-binding protein [Acetobacteraceae bacterium]|nr:ABC transporter substrate-binding protein [Pseudomonadota bacterium]